MSALTKTLLPVVLLIVVVIGALFVVKHQAERVKSEGSHVVLKEGGQAPDFTLTDLGGKTATVSSIVRKIVIVNFWASWCQACLVEIPSLVKLRKQLNTKGLDIAFVNVDDHPETMAPGILSRFGVDFMSYSDPEQKLSALFDVHGIPYTVILDKNRKILFVETGDRDWNAREVHEQLDKWLVE